MSRSTRFPVAVHALAMMAIHPDEHCSSELIAKSAGTNAVVVRRVLALLQKAGFVSCQAGVRGGAKLCVPPQAVSLLDVYAAVEESELFRMHTPHPDCPLACSVKDNLTPILQRAEQGMKAELATQSLASLTDRVARRVNKSQRC